MTILLLVRNYTPAHEQIISGGWNVAQVAKNTFDLEGKVVGTLGAGRIGYRVLERLVPFDCAELLYYDYQPLPKEAEAKVGAKRVEDLKEFLGKLDVLTINAPLHEGTKGLINKEKLGWMKKGAWIVNTARVSAVPCDESLIRRLPALALVGCHLQRSGCCRCRQLGTDSRLRRVG
jgi:formate dehydrogenase